MTRYYHMARLESVDAVTSDELCRCPLNSRDEAIQALAEVAANTPLHSRDLTYLETRIEEPDGSVRIENWEQEAYEYAREHNL